MNWDAIGAVGEILGAITVVATLFYLAKQIRQNSASLDRANDYAQASSVHDINSLYIQVFAPLSQNSELAELYKNATEGSELDAVDAVRFGAFVNTFLAWVETMYFQQRHDLGFTTESLDSMQKVLGPYVRRLLSAEAGLRWWQTEGTDLFTGEFVEFIERIRAAEE